jgi:hypothetical protein
MAVKADALFVYEPGHEGCTSQPDGCEEDGAPVTVELVHAVGVVAQECPLPHLVLAHLAKVQWRWVRHFCNSFCVVVCSVD